MRREDAVARSGQEAGGGIAPEGPDPVPRKERVDQARLEAARAARANQVRRTLKELRRLPTPAAAARLARNLAPMIAAAKKARKGGATLGELVLRAKVSTNPDETRLGRFRLTERSGAGAAANLSRNPSHYLGLAEEAARMAGRPVDQAVLDLVDGTEWHPAASGAASEGFLRVHDLLQHVVSSIAKRQDLDWYFDETARRGAFRTGSNESPDNGWTLERGIGDASFNAPSVGLLHTTVSRMPGEMLGADGAWHPIDVQVLERVRFGIAKMWGDPAPSGYFFLSPCIGISERGSPILDLLSCGLPMKTEGEIGDYFSDRLGGKARRITFRLLSGRALQLGPYGQFVDWMGEPWEVGLTERLSVSGIERVLGTSDFQALPGSNDRAEESEAGYTEAPPETAAARIEGLILYGYAGISLTSARGGDTILKALEDDAREHAETFKTFLGRQREAARAHAARVVETMYERPDPAVVGFFDNVALEGPRTTGAEGRHERHSPDTGYDEAKEQG